MNERMNSRNVHIKFLQNVTFARILTGPTAGHFAQEAPLREAQGLSRLEM
jgi:hypothetical protein